jgi:hypothetical protein
MKPTSFKETNTIFGPGGNPNTQQLPACIATAPQHTGGIEVPFIVSRWKLDDDEIEKIRQTGEIWIAIMGKIMPPIMPVADHPFEQLGFKPVDK